MKLLTQTKIGNMSNDSKLKELLTKCKFSD